MAYTMFTLWIIGMIVSLIAIYILLRILYPKRESSDESAIDGS